MKNYNYVAPYQERFLFSEQQKQRAEAARQQATQSALQRQAVKRQKQDTVDYSGVYGFDTTGWSQEYMDLFKQMQDHVGGKLFRSEYEGPQFNSDAQSLINAHRTIKNMWDLSSASMNKYISVMSDPASHGTDDMEIVETPEEMEAKLEYARNWGMVDSYFNPDEMMVYGRFIGPDGSPLNNGNFMRLDEHPYITAEFWNPRMEPKASITPDELAVKFQGLVRGLADEGISRLEIEKRIKDRIISNVNDNAYGRSPQVHFENTYGTTETLEGVDPATAFANDTWKLLQTYWPEDTTGSGSGSGDEEARLTPQDIRVYGPVENVTLMQGENYPVEKKYAVNFGSWIGKRENFDIIQSALSEAGLSLDKVDAGFIPQKISYSDGKFTIEAPMTPSGSTIPGLVMTFDPDVMIDKSVLDQIERRYRDIYGVRCTLEEIVTRSCGDLNESVIEEELDWGGL